MRPSAKTSGTCDRRHARARLPPCTTDFWTPQQTYAHTHTHAHIRTYTPHTPTRAHCLDTHQNKFAAIERSRFLVWVIVGVELLLLLLRWHNSVAPKRAVEMVRCKRLFRKRACKSKRVDRYVQAGKQASGQAGKQASGQAGKQASRQAGKRASGQAGKRASRQAGTHTHTHAQ